MIKTPNPATPGIIKPSSSTTATPTPFTTHHRFMLSSATQQPGSYSGNPQTPAPTQPQPSKPTFILPRSPSPSRGEGEEGDYSPPHFLSITTPFSPSSRTTTLHKNRHGGRPRSNPPSYLPGGMAAEVRSWILEAGMKREGFNGGHTSSSVPETGTNHPDRYSVTVRVEKASRDILNSSGPLTFVEGRPVNVTWPRAQAQAQTQGQECESDLEPEFRKILLLGPPRSSKSVDGRTSPQAPGLGEDSLVGIHRGLVWEVELKLDGHGHPGESGVEREGGTSCTRATATEKWLVAMEWDLLQ